MNERNEVSKADILQERHPASWVSNKLKISTATVRKYSVLVEKNAKGQEFRFHSNEGEPRYYTTTDLNLFNKALQLVKYDNVTVKSAMKKVFSQIDDDYVTLENTIQSDTRNEAVAILIKENKVLKSQLNNINKKLDRMLSLLDKTNDNTKDIINLNSPNIDKLTVKTKNNQKRKHWWWPVKNKRN